MSSSTATRRWSPAKVPAGSPRSTCCCPPSTARSDEHRDRRTPAARRLVLAAVRLEQHLQPLRRHPAGRPAAARRDADPRPGGRRPTLGRAGLPARGCCSPCPPARSSTGSTGVRRWPTANVFRAAMLGAPGRVASSPDTRRCRSSTPWRSCSAVRRRSTTARPGRCCRVVVTRAQLERGNSLLTTAESVGNIFLGAPLGAWLFAVAASLPAVGQLRCLPVRRLPGPHRGRALRGRPLERVVDA